MDAEVVDAGPPLAWVLNLDSEDELARGTLYRPPTLAKRAELANRALASGLVRADDFVLDGHVGVRDDRPAHGLLGAAFMPTPYALRRLAEAGAVVPRAPTLEALRRANERSILLPRLDGAVLVRKREDALLALDRHTPSELWLCKRAFGAAGRGHRRVPARRVRELDVAWIDATLRKTGAIEITPWLDRVADFAMHGALSENGELTVGAPTIQLINAADAWSSSRLAAQDELSESERAALRAAVDEAAAALLAVGYFGPFGIDGFRYRAPDSRLAFCSCCDVNARYTMGFAVGMDARAPAYGAAPT